MIRRDDGAGARALETRGDDGAGARALDTRGDDAAGTDAVGIRVVLPSPLRVIAQVGAEIRVSVAGAVTLQRVLDAVESRYPMLRGTMRDHGSHKRRAFVRFYACERDLSLQSPDTLLPEPVANGTEPLLVIGAMAGG